MCSATYTKIMIIHTLVEVADVDLSVLGVCFCTVLDKSVTIIRTQTFKGFQRLHCVYLHTLKRVTVK